MTHLPARRCPQKRGWLRAQQRPAHSPAGSRTARVPPRAGTERGASRPAAPGAGRSGAGRAEPGRAGVAAPAGQPQPRQPPPRSRRCQCHGVRRGTRGSAGARPPDPRGQAPACSPHPGAAAAADRGALEVLPAAAAAVAGQDVLQVHLHPAARRGGGKAAGGPGHAAPGTRSGPRAERGPGTPPGRPFPAAPPQSEHPLPARLSAGRGGGGRAGPRREHGKGTNRPSAALESRGCRGRRERLQPGRPRRSLRLSPPGLRAALARPSPGRCPALPARQTIKENNQETPQHFHLVVTSRQQSPSAVL